MGVICNGEQPQPQSRSNNKRYIYHNRIVFLQNQGFTIKEISKELNIAVATVYGSLKQYGNEIYKKRGRNKQMRK